MDKVAKRDKKPETKELVNEWAARIAGKEAELAEARAEAAAAAAGAEAEGAAAVKAEPGAEGTAGPAGEAGAEGALPSDGSSLHRSQWLHSAA